MEQTSLADAIHEWDKARKARLEAERGQTILTTKWAERRQEARNREKVSRKALLKMGSKGKEYVAKKLRNVLESDFRIQMLLRDRPSSILPEIVGHPIPDILPADTPVDSDRWCAFNTIKDYEIRISKLKAELDKIDDP